MAKNRSDFADFKNPDTLIGLGVYVEGTLEAEGDVQINGKFKGKLVTNGDAIIGDSANIDANIDAHNVYVAGEVKGNILAQEKIEIMETGRVLGNVESSALSIEPGGILKGKSSMLEHEESTPSITPTYEVEEEKSEESKS
jgi:cytoskeletal protein CcmA (bactofilin family)